MSSAFKWKQSVEKYSTISYPASSWHNPVWNKTRRSVILQVLAQPAKILFREQPRDLEAVQRSVLWAVRF